MKLRKKMSKIMLIATLLVGLTLVVMASVGAADSSTADEKSNDANSDYNPLIIGSLLVLVIISLVSIYMRFDKAEPIPTETRVEPVFEPVFENYDREAWSSSTGTWSKVNDSWGALPQQAGRVYGSLDEQYEKLYK